MVDLKMLDRREKEWKAENALPKTSKEDYARVTKIKNKIYKERKIELQRLRNERKKQEREEKYKHLEDR